MLKLRKACKMQYAEEITIEFAEETMNKNYFKIDTIPAILWGEPSDKVYLFVHGKGGNKEGTSIDPPSSYTAAAPNVLAISRI